MLWFDAEIEGEEWTEGFIASEANEGSKGNQEDSEQGDRCDGEVGQIASMRGGRAKGG